MASVLCQSYTNLEIICVDDGSTDGTLALLRRFEKASPDRVRVLVGSNKGAPAARNWGLREAKGEYIQFMDADDLLHPAKIAHQVSIIEREQHRPDLVAGSWELREIDSSSQIIQVRNTDPWLCLIKSRLGNTVSNLWKRMFVAGIGGFDENLKSSQEADLMFRMLQNTAHVCFDGKSLTIVRRRSGSITATAETRCQVIHRRVLVRKRIMEYLRSSGELTKERAVALFQDFFISLEMLYWMDRDLATRLHEELTPYGFKPSRGLLCSVVYELFGFGAVFRLRRLWGRVR